MTRPSPAPRHTEACSDDDCPCYLAGCESERRNLADANADLREAIRRVQEVIAEDAES